MHAESPFQNRILIVFKKKTKSLDLVIRKRQNAIDGIK